MDFATIYNASGRTPAATAGCFDGQMVLVVYAKGGGVIDLQLLAVIAIGRLCIGGAEFFGEKLYGHRRPVRAAAHAGLRPNKTQLRSWRCGRPPRADKYGAPQQG
jgi:hypothetical protein